MRGRDLFSKVGQQSKASKTTKANVDLHGSKEKNLKGQEEECTST